MIELEKTYLVKYLPKDLEKSNYKEVVDKYFPLESEHPKLRLRKCGDKLELTKKQAVEEGNASIMEEQTISLTQEEYGSLNKLEGKKLRKRRYYYNYENRIAEFDIFMDDLEGLALVDVEFELEEEKESFSIPDFCLVDITQEEFIAGGMLCGKSYEDIKEELNKFNYEKLFFNFK